MLLLIFNYICCKLQHSMMKYILILVVLVSILGACNRTSKEVTKNKTKSETKVEVIKPKKTDKVAVYEDFESFYTKFHHDSIFQIKRVKFPLEGYAIDTSEQATRWSKNNWITHRNTVNKIDTAVFTIETSKQKNSYYEKVYIEGGGFSSERAFKRINGKWFLVKFVDEDL